MKENFNVNSVLLIIFTVAVAIAGWGLNETYRSLNEKVSDLKESIMPKHEVELQLEALRIRITAVELEISRLKK